MWDGGALKALVPLAAGMARVARQSYDVRDDSDDCDESGDFMDKLDSCIVLSRMLSCAWGANCLDNLEWEDMKLLGCSNLRAWRS